MSELNSTLPNPDTPLAFFSPTDAYQASVSIYVHVASAAVMIWDVLDNVSNEYRLLFREKINIVSAAYLVSRGGSLAFTIGCAIFETSALGDCNRVDVINNISFPIALGGTSLLFFFRLRAIYNSNPTIVTAFLLLWFASLGCMILLPIQGRGSEIGNTKYCVDANVPNSVYASIFAPLVYDTLVYAAITYRLAQASYVDTVEGNFKAALFGKYLPTLSRGLLLDGQRYYLVSFLSNLMVVALVLDSAATVPIRSMGAAMNIVITNIMACRVYRRTRFGHFGNETNCIINRQGEVRPTASIPISFAPGIGNHARVTSNSVGNRNSTSSEMGAHTLATKERRNVIDDDEVSEVREE